MKIVKVEWIDSYSTNTWINKEAVVEQMGGEFIMTTTGYLVNSNKTGVIICHSYCDTMLCGCIHIPRKSIKTIITIK